MQKKICNHQKITKQNIKPSDQYKNDSLHCWSKAMCKKRWLIAELRQWMDWFANCEWQCLQCDELQYYCKCSFNTLCSKQHTNLDTVVLIRQPRELLSKGANSLIDALIGKKCRHTEKCYARAYHLEHFHCAAQQLSVNKCTVSIHWCLHYEWS